MGTLASMKDILLAEDDSDDVEIFDLAMKGLDISYILRHAENGDALFIMLKDKQPYILFLDVHMPCKDGLACIVEIRKNRDYDKMPVIMYSSEVSKRVVEEAYRSGANLFLAKTNTISDLTDKLKKVFSVEWENYLHFPPHSQFMVD